MTDRDHFAAAALPLCTRNGRNAEQISESAYKLADAMLRMRDKPLPPALTADEREAIETALNEAEAHQHASRAATLRKLLERLQ
jgi:hypothetical protein